MKLLLPITLTAIGVLLSGCVETEYYSSGGGYYGDVPAYVPYPPAETTIGYNRDYQPKRKRHHSGGYYSSQTPRKRGADGYYSSQTPPKPDGVEPNGGYHSSQTPPPPKPGDVEPNASGYSSSQSAAKGPRYNPYTSSTASNGNRSVDGYRSSN